MQLPPSRIINRIYMVRSHPNLRRPRILKSVLHWCWCWCRWSILCVRTPPIIHSQTERRLSTLYRTSNSLVFLSLWEPCHTWPRSREVRTQNRCFEAIVSPLQLWRWELNCRACGAPRSLATRSLTIGSHPVEWDCLALMTSARHCLFQFLSHTTTVMMVMIFPIPSQCFQHPVQLTLRCLVDLAPMPKKKDPIIDQTEQYDGCSNATYNESHDRDLCDFNVLGYSSLHVGCD